MLSSLAKLEAGISRRRTTPQPARNGREKRVWKRYKSQTQPHSINGILLFIALIPFPSMFTSTNWSSAINVSSHFWNLTSKSLLPPPLLFSSLLSFSLSSSPLFYFSPDKMPSRMEIWLYICVCVNAHWLNFLEERHICKVYMCIRWSGSMSLGNTSLVSLTLQSSSTLQSAMDRPSQCRIHIEPNPLMWDAGGWGKVIPRNWSVVHIS